MWKKKRQNAAAVRTEYAKYPKFRSVKAAAQLMERIVNRNIETKTSVSTAADGTEILHNDFATLDSVLLQTTQGITDPRAAASSNRIGDKVTIRNVQLRLMLELNERYSDVTFRLFVIKSARGDVPTRTTLFNGQSGNKMLDTVNTERYTIIKSKQFKMVAPNQVLNGAISGGPPITPEGVFYGGLPAMSRATKIIKINLPGKLFGRGGQVQYDNNSTSVKFFDYTVQIYAYSNILTAQDIWYVGRVNDYIKVMTFKDA